MNTNRSLSPSYGQTSSSRGEDDFDDRSSWVDFDDSDDGHDAYVRDSKFSSNGIKDEDDSRRQSVASYDSRESRPDIGSVLETLNVPTDQSEIGYMRESTYSRGEDQSIYQEDEDYYDDPHERETAYYTSPSTFPSDVEDIPPVPVRPKGLTVNTAARSVGRYSTSPSPSPSEFDDEDMDDVGNRKSHASFMDAKRSERVREKLMKRVEKMRREGEQSALR